MSLEAVLFYVFGGLALGGALAMVLFLRNLVAGAMSLVVSMIALAGIYVLLGAYLVAVVQIMVYAGAILVLFLFVIMLLNLRGDSFERIPLGRRALKIVGVGISAWIFLEFVRVLPSALPTPGSTPPGFGGYRELGLQLFSDYVVPVEAAALIMLAAIVGAVILAKRRID